MDAIAARRKKAFWCNILTQLRWIKHIKPEIEFHSNQVEFVFVKNGGNWVANISETPLELNRIEANLCHWEQRGNWTLPFRSTDTTITKWNRAAFPSSGGCNGFGQISSSSCWIFSPTIWNLKQWGLVQFNSRERERERRKEKPIKENRTDSAIEILIIDNSGLPAFRPSAPDWNQYIYFIVLHLSYFWNHFNLNLTRNCKCGSNIIGWFSSAVVNWRSNQFSSNKE